MFRISRRSRLGAAPLAVDSRQRKIRAPVKALRHTLYMFQIFRQGDLAFRQYQKNVIGEEALRSFLQVVRLNTNTVLGSESWEQFRPNVGQQYIDYVESMPAICAPRWRCIE